MPAAVMNIKLEQGVDYSRFLNLSDDAGALDLSLDSFAGSIKATYADAAPLVAFTFDLTRAAEGIIGYSLSNAETSSLPDTTGTDKLVYDIEWTKADSTVVRLLMGKVKVSPQVTLP